MNPFSQISAILESARAAEDAGRATEAVELAWRAFDLDPGGLEAKAVLTRLLHADPGLLDPDRREGFERLLADPGADPLYLARAGWRLLLRAEEPLATLADGALAQWAEEDELALALLEQSHVAVLEAERLLTRLRRWLLLSGQDGRFPRLVRALARQARHNGGAWLIDSAEKARLKEAPGSAIADAYFPPAYPRGAEPSFDSAVTDAVAGQYGEFPFPAWERVADPRPTTLPAAVEKLDAGRPSGLPVDAEILVAGCGTGREAVLLARRFPDAKVTAIDISETSLAYARERCTALGVAGIDFRLLDLHRVAQLGRSFDFISCSGVLHHLPDPEAGWAVLSGVLKPRGAMRIMLYSKVGRLRIGAARAAIADLLGEPVDAERLRAVRARLIDKAPQLVSGIGDFYTLGGVYDLLLHRHEDPFDVPRTAAALDRLGLELLAFRLPTPAHRRRYREEHPDDALFRDIQAWSRLERKDPFLFSGMYEFWCRKPPAGPQPE